MIFYVYILQSETDNSYYRGITEDFFKRIKEHNSGLSKYTSRKIPWKLVYLETYNSKKEVLIREKVLKKYSHQQILTLIGSSRNKNQYLVDEWLKSIPNNVGD